MGYRRIRFGQIGNSKVIAFAVQEVVKYLKKMDAKLVIDVLQTEAAQKDFEQIIWVGLDRQLATMVPPVEDIKQDDAIAVVIKNGNGYITGSNERSVLLATYRFLKEFGCDWVRPGVEGERVPVKFVENINVNIYEAASYRHRGVTIEGANAYENIFDMIDYLPKVGMNSYFVQLILPQIFFEKWYQHYRNPYLEQEGINRKEASAMTVSLETEIAKRGICYHKTGHGWTCEPFGIAASWDEMSEDILDKEIKSYLAEVNGKRQLWGNVPINTNLCYSNEVVRKKMTDAIVNYCKSNIHVDVLHFWLADEGNNHCECAECVRKRPADWYVIMLNELDEKLTAEGITTRVVFLIYMDLLWECVEEQLNNPDRFILMFAPCSRNYGKSYADDIAYNDELPLYNRNHLVMPRSLAQNLEHLRRWQCNFQGDGFLFDYHLMGAHIHDLGYEACARNVFEDMKVLHMLGLNGMISCQVQRCFFPTALPFNMMAAALWDKNCDYEEKVKLYYKSAFGEEGILVHHYLNTISELMLLYEGPANGTRLKDKKVFCKDYVKLREEITSFEPVIRRNIAKEGIEQEDWKILYLHSDYMKLVINFLELLEHGEQEEKKEASKRLNDWIRKNEMGIQKVLDGNNTQVVWERRL